MLFALVLEKFGRLGTPAFKKVEEMPPGPPTIREGSAPIAGAWLY